MASYFIDTSALVKRYFAEAGSDWTNALLAQGDALLFMAHLTLAEVTSAVVRRAPAHETSRILTQFEADSVNLFNTVPLNDTLVEPAVRLVKDHRLRGCDALQLASALIIAIEIGDLIFVSADNDLNAAASAEGLMVDNPNKHL